MSALLHIKDSYYFEVPKFLLRSHRAQRSDFPEYWVRLDDQYQDWEASRLVDGLQRSGPFKNMPSKGKLLTDYHQWRQQDKNFAKPLDRFLETDPSQAWFQQTLVLGKFARQEKGESEAVWRQRQASGRAVQKQWQAIKQEAEDVALFNQQAPAWSVEKLSQYNAQLDGKILIPQPFGKLKNNYEPEAGFCISKYMIIQLAVAAILIWLFSRLARNVRDGRPAKGKLWNLLETFLLFIRDEVARPAIGKHDADRFVPLLWTIFLFILGCNLMGLLPWVGAPTASFGVTFGLALVTFTTGLVFGSQRFGILGYWKNLVPTMGLPLLMAIPIVPMLFVIEVLGLLIKHTVLGVRLLANMVAGHLVLLALMGLAVAAAASTSWPMTAGISVVGSALFSCLELFVAFLQAYVFTFLSALFIGSAIHHH